MEVRDCKFCGCPATYAPIERMEVSAIKVFFCHPCSTEYLFFSRNGVPVEKPSSISLYTTINSKMYRWTTMASGHVQVWLVKIPGVPGLRINEGMEPVVHFDDLEIAVTPQNIEEKLRKWLPFL